MKILDIGTTLKFLLFAHHVLGNVFDNSRDISYSYFLKTGGKNLPVRVQRRACHTLETMVLLLSKNQKYPKNFFTIFVPKKLVVFDDKFTLLFFFNLIKNFIIGDVCTENRLLRQNTVFRKQNVLLAMNVAPEFSSRHHHRLNYVFRVLWSSNVPKLVVCGNSEVVPRFQNIVKP